MHARQRDLLQSFSSSYSVERASQGLHQEDGARVSHATREFSMSPVLRSILVDAASWGICVHAWSNLKLLLIVYLRDAVGDLADEDERVLDSTSMMEELSRKSGMQLERSAAYISLSRGVGAAKSRVETLVDILEKTFHEYVFLWGGLRRMWRPLPSLNKAPSSSA